MSDDYEVGYGKPPQSGQFKKGQSGNRKGRPPKTDLDAASVVAVLDGPVRIKTGGGEDDMPAFEASVRKLASRAINNGDIQAGLQFLRLCDQYEVITAAPEPVSGGVLWIPNSWDSDEWSEMLEAYGPPPWPGKRSGLVE